ncbi:MAG: DUF3037 domain-containing protein [Caldilineaceae bacterium]|jgi:hypothetical protein
MPEISSYDYAYVRVKPSQAIGDFVTVGAILFCRTLGFLEARIDLDVERVRMLAPELDIAALERHLALIPRICAGEGPIGQLGQAESFHWLVAPHNTVVQTSSVHSGLCADPEAALTNLMRAVRCR